MNLTREQRSQFIAGGCPKIAGEGKCPWEVGHEVNVTTGLTVTIERIVRKGEKWHLRYVVRDSRHTVRNLRGLPTPPPDWRIERIWRVEWTDESGKARSRLFNNPDDFPPEPDQALERWRVTWTDSDGRSRSQICESRKQADEVSHLAERAAKHASPEGIDRAAEDSAYTSQLDGPLSDAGEGIDRETQIRYSARAAAENLARRVASAGAGADIPVDGQLAGILAEAKRRGVDVSGELRVIRKRMEAMQQKIVHGGRAA